MSEELVVRFFAALEAGDIETVRAIYAPDDGAMYLQVTDGHITRIEEYMDSGKRASIRSGREALAAADEAAPRRGR
jgi:ketosteroid isomerase-like protein